MKTIESKHLRRQRGYGGKQLSEEIQDVVERYQRINWADDWFVRLVKAASEDNDS